MAKPRCKCVDPNAPRRSFGSLQILPSGRHRARYTLPGTDKWINAPSTFGTHGEAEAWLAGIRADIVRGTWMPPDSKLTFGQYADIWLPQRRVKGRPLKPRTRQSYQNILDELLRPTFQNVPIRNVTPALVRQWHSGLSNLTPTKNAHAYALLKTIFSTAVMDEVLVANPCRIRGAGRVPRKSKTEPATLDELAVIVDAITPTYRPMILLAAWCAIRFGELTELRGTDIDTKNGVIRIRRGVVWLQKNERLDGVRYCDCAPGRALHAVVPPKSDAGVRDVNIPPHLTPIILQHILATGLGRGDKLLFPAHQVGGHLPPSSLYRVYFPAREAAGRPDLRFHDLRHTGATLAAATGATIAELMARLGHSTPGAALIYQHAAKGRDAEIAKALSKLAGQ